jgi:hypothetical protein
MKKDDAEKLKFRKFAKELGVRVKDENIQALRDKLLDAIDKKARKDGDSWIDNHQEMVDYFNQFAEDDDEGGEQDE